MRGEGPGSMVEAGAQLSALQQTFDVSPPKRATRRVTARSTRVKEAPARKAEAATAVAEAAAPAAAVARKAPATRGRKKAAAAEPQPVAKA